MTGFSARVRLLIRTRAGWGDPDNARCENCGRWLGRDAGQCQHRVARGIGGSKDPVVNGAANGALLCGTVYWGCHYEAEKRTPFMEDRGFFIRPGSTQAHDPLWKPIGLLLPSGRREERWLTMDGRYSDFPPALETAA